MRNGDQSNHSAGVPGLPKAEWLRIIIEAVKDPIKLLALVALVVLLIIIFGASKDAVDGSVYTILAVVLALIVVGAVGVLLMRPTAAPPPEPEKFKEPSGPHYIELGQEDILGANKSRPDLDTWYRKLRPTLHQASFYTVPTYYLDTDLNVLDYNIAFEIVFHDIAGKLRGKHVSWLIARLKNKLEVFEHGRVFTERVMETGVFPFIDLEPITYESRDFGLVEFIKVASQLHDEGGNLQGWAVALMIRSIEWEAFEKVLKDKLYLDKLWSVYSGPYDRILTQFPPYLQLIEDVTAVVAGENCSVVDLGAGTGNVTTALLAKGHRVTAVENNVGMLDHLGLKTKEKRNGLTIVKASVENLECLNDESFDAVVMVNVLYAVDDPLRCLREIHRILVPGGVLGFSTTHSETRLDNLLERIRAQGRLDGADGRAMSDYNVLERVNRNIERTIARRHSREKYKEWVRDAGFEITRYDDSTYHKAVMLIHAKKITTEPLRTDTEVERYAAEPQYARLNAESRTPAGMPYVSQPYTQPRGRGSAQLAAVPEQIIRGHAAEPAARNNDTRPAPNIAVGEGLFGGIRAHKLRGALVLGLLSTVAAAVAYVLVASSSSHPPITSVAVLPFINGTDDPNIQIISDGLSESLINGLSGLSQLKVAAREDSFNYRKGNVDPQEVAKALNVLAIVTGKVERHGDKLSISAWLVDARDKTQMWGDRFVRRQEDLGPVEAEIAEHIAEKLRLSLTPQQHENLSQGKQANPRAYELLLKGRFYQQKLSKEGISQSLVFFNQALVIDPNYALSHAALAGAYLDLIYNSYIDPKEALPKAEAAARRAVQLDESLADAHIVLGRINLIQWDWSGAEQEVRRALQLSPNVAAAHTVYWLYLCCQGRHEEAIAEAKLARDLGSPIALVYSANLGYALYFAGRYDEAIEQLKKTLELDAQFGFADRLLGYAYAANGNFDEAVEEYQRLLRHLRMKDNTSDQCFRGYALAKAGKRDEAEAILKSLQTTDEYVSPAELAVLYAGLDRKNQALESLERAFAKRDLQIQYLKVEPHYESLRSDPRFTALIKKVGLPPQS